VANSSIVGVLRALLTLDTAQFEQATKRVADDAKKLTAEFKTFGRQATELGSALTKTITLPLAGLGIAAAKAAIDFESSFAGVGKTVDGVMDKSGDLTDLGKEIAQSFRDLAKTIPVNVNELNKIGEAAGALGIKKDDIVEFTRVMAMLGVTTNLTSDEAANAVARIQNIFGAAGKDTERLASTLVALGNAGASTEKEIAEMALRIAGAGNTVGLTQAQVLSFASTLSSVGINAEAGGSAISRIFLKMNDAVMSGGE
jgi:TP901 family phage tail tape measure protein